MKEQDIRPQELLERYLQLSKEDAVQCFANEERQPIPCVACGSSKHEEQFEKSGFSYGQCRDCGTLFQTPRPPLKHSKHFTAILPHPITGQRFFFQQLLRPDEKKYSDQESNDFFNCVRTMAKK